MPKKAGVDFHLGYSPVRIDPGNPDWHLERLLRQDVRFISLANEMNDQMPAYVTSRITGD